MGVIFENLKYSAEGLIFNKSIPNLYSIKKYILDNKIKFINSNFINLITLIKNNNLY